MRSFSERFWSRVQQSVGCWTWMSTKDRQGYGVLSTCPSTGRKFHKAHRVAWELTNGTIPNNLCVLHRCDNPACCRPDHLFLGTNLDNVHDRDQKRRGYMGPKLRAKGNKLTADDVRSIRAMLAAGGGKRETAIQFNVSTDLVRRIVNRQVWNHV